jgi:thiosulfate reductase cytochrome b subunit
MPVKFLFPKTHPLRLGLVLAAAGLLILISAVWVSVLAHPAALPAVQVSPMHPLFPLLDAQGENVLKSGEPVSTMQTCGSCHDTQFIEQHSAHASLGYTSFGQPGKDGSSRPWDSGSGFFGSWDPVLYRYLSPEGDSDPDLTLPGWIQQFGKYHAGGGPAVYSSAGEELLGLEPLSGSSQTNIVDPQTGELVPWDWSESGIVEMNCFLCHTPNPDNDARIAFLESGRYGWANTASLLGSLAVEQVGESLVYNPAAFSENGELLPGAVQIQDPTNENCAQCHGYIHTDPAVSFTLDGCVLDNWPGSLTGTVISAQRVSDSAINLAGKAAVSRPFDVHAERLVQCTDCHHAANNPTFAQITAAGGPEHLQFDPRRLEIGEYLERPLHIFALSSDAPHDPSLPSACASCHSVEATHNWLPYKGRHFNALACESCHIPQTYAPALKQVDWTVLQPGGSPRVECRGADGDSVSLSTLVSGYKPVLLPRLTPAGEKLSPYNLVSTSYWVYGDPPRPVSAADLEAAWFSDGRYPAEIIAVFDGDSSGYLDPQELRLDTQEKVDLIAARLENRGLKNPRTASETQAYPLHHGVAPGSWATRDCQVCHSSDSLLGMTMALGSFLPSQEPPALFGSGEVRFTGSFSATDDGGMEFTSVPSQSGLYILGHDYNAWIDLFGALAFTGTLLGAALHGSLRFVSALRRSHPLPKLKKVYMYAVYERFWHWLQTVVILGLLFTGLIIHRPAVFGIFSFQYVVLVHNVLAALLVINAGLSLFYHLASGEIKQFIPRPAGFFDQAVQQGLFYLRGIFRNEAHPFQKSPQKKMNPLQQATYFAILNVLLPLQIITGALMWGAQRWSATESLGGLPFLSPAHTLIAWTFASFIVMHVYLTTTGHAPLAGIQAMMLGWDEVETNQIQNLEEEPV